MSRLDNIQIFKDTIRLCEDNDELKEAICISNDNQEFYSEFGTSPKLSENRYDTPAQIIVSDKRTLKAASSYAGEKVCVLNFASAKNPGGGVGSSEIIIS